MFSKHSTGESRWAGTRSVSRYLIGSDQSVEADPSTSAVRQKPSGGVYVAACVLPIAHEWLKGGHSSLKSQ